MVVECAEVVFDAVNSTFYFRFNREKNAKKNNSND